MDTQFIKKQIEDAHDYLKSTNIIIKTPLLDKTTELSKITNLDHNLFIKSEVTQVSGCFKIRGLLNQTRDLESKGSMRIVTMSAGNYGRTMADFCQRKGHDGFVVMPEFAPIERTEYIQSKGLQTVRLPTKDMESKLDELEKTGRIYLHPYDDWNLVYGHASFGLEILEDCKDVDIVIVPCGGGAILAATALAVKLFGGSHIKVYGVEPINANTMERSLNARKPVGKSDSSSIASGLSPPNAGKVTFEICQAYVDGIITVTDDIIMQAMSNLHSIGVKAEPSGSAGLAALLTNENRVKFKLPNKRLNIVIAVTGGNCSKQDFERLHG